MLLYLPFFIEKLNEVSFLKQNILIFRNCTVVFFLNFCMRFFENKMEIYFSSKKKRRRGRLIGSVRCGGYYFLFFFYFVCLKSNFEMGLVSFFGKR